jgi:uncharacterized protein (TIGR00369 family)
MRRSELSAKTGVVSEAPRVIDVALINQMLTSGVVPLNTALGLRAVASGPAWVTFELPWAEQLVGNPETGVLHGGAITALLDAASGTASSIAMPVPSRVATVDLRIDYMGPSTRGRNVFARAECYKVTKHIAFTRAVAYHDVPEEPIGAAAGTFMLFPGELSPTSVPR